MSARVHAGFTTDDIPVHVVVTNGGANVHVELDHSVTVLLDVATATKLARQILAAVGGES